MRLIKNSLFLAAAMFVCKEKAVAVASHPVQVSPMALLAVSCLPLLRVAQALDPLIFISQDCKTENGS